MKKYLLILLSALMMVSLTPFHIFAGEIESDYSSDPVVVYSPEDDRTYMIKVYDHSSEIYDYDTLELLATMTVSTDELYIAPIEPRSLITPGDSLNATPDDYESWTSYYYVTRDDFHIDGLTSLTVYALQLLIENYYGAGWVNTLFELATMIKSNSVEDGYALIYRSTNIYCSILIKEKYNFYKNNGSFLKTEYKNPRWLGSPYDYTQPNACRVLVNRYTY